jgi:phosphoadenosine phosphosulfate reductase
MTNSDLNWKIEQSKKVIEKALDKWFPDIGAAFTGRKDSSVMMHMILSVTKEPPKCMFIDHGLHFLESIEHIKKLEKLWNLSILFVADKKLLNKLEKEKDKENRAKLVRELKIKTIKSTIKKQKWKALFTAIRRDENPARADEKYFSKRKDHYRIHPMLHWSEEDIWDYIKKNKISYNPLYDQGYRSIGEKEFTKKSDDGERSGREKNKENVMERLRALGYF